MAAFIAVLSRLSALLPVIQDLSWSITQIGAMLYLCDLVMILLLLPLLTFLLNWLYEPILVRNELVEIPSLGMISSLARNDDWWEYAFFNFL